MVYMSKQFSFSQYFILLKFKLKMIKIKLLLFMFVCLNFVLIEGIDNGVGKTPPMGWNGWNLFQCNANETIIKQFADKIIQLGLDKKGYTYINLDDCWQIGRQWDSKVIIVDENKFPSGIKSLADYMHSKGLKFGIYSDAGTNTCDGRPGSYGFEKIDAQTYANWGVDYLKYDNCYNLGISSRIRYQVMSKALNETGKTIFFSMCNWGQQKVWQWAANVGNSWRTTGDIQPEWESIVKILDNQVGLEKYAGVGGWNDPDMLQIGNGNLTYDESLSHFTMWCLLKAPLLLGCDLSKLDKWELDIISNQELIGINQDEMGVQGTKVKFEKDQKCNKQVWGGPLSKNRYALVFFNRGDIQTSISVSLKNDLKLTYQEYSQRDPVRHQDINATSDDMLFENVAAHGVEVRILTLKKSKPLFQE